MSTNQNQSSPSKYEKHELYMIKTLIKNNGSKQEALNLLSTLKYTENHFKLIKYLIEQQNTSITDPVLISEFKIHAGNGFENVVKYMVKQGADPNLVIKYSGNLDIVKWLVKHGGNIDILADAYADYICEDGKDKDDLILQYLEDMGYRYDCSDYSCDEN